VDYVSLSEEAIMDDCTVLAGAQSNKPRKHLIYSSFQQDGFGSYRQSYRQRGATL
jgi:hypothetical protein